MKRGEVWWADLSEPTASEPGFRRPVLILQSDEFNRSRINTVIVAVITSNLNLAAAPGNVTLPKRSANLGRESVVNVSQIVTLDKERSQNNLPFLLVFLPVFFVVLTVT